MNIGDIVLLIIPIVLCVVCWIGIIILCFWANGRFDEAYIEKVRIESSINRCAIRLFKFYHKEMNTKFYSFSSYKKVYKYCMKIAKVLEKERIR